MSLGAGACLNPAFGMVQTIYWIGLAATYGHVYDASCIWVYVAMPFVGAFLASVVYGYHHNISSQYQLPEPDVQDKSPTAAAAPDLPPKKNGEP